MFRFALPALTLTLCLSVAPLSAAPSPTGSIEDLPYGEVLFDFFQEDYFTAITRLQIARQRQQVSHHEPEAELLQGGLLLSYGLYDEAEAIFQRLLSDDDSRTSTRQRAWYHLARIWYQQGYTEKALTAIERVSIPQLAEERQDQALLLHSRILMDLGDYSAAADLLATPTRSSLWSYYAYYNLGVALIRSGQTDMGLQLIGDVSDLDSDTEELQVLRDQANLLLAYRHLQRKRSESARRYLRRIRLQGPSAAAALLGLGWAEFAAGEPARALAVWDELSRRNPAETTVQESLLAIPYVLVEAGDFRQASERYQLAIDKLMAEQRRLDGLQQQLQQDRFIDRLAGTDSDRRQNSRWSLTTLPEALNNNAFRRLLASHEFQSVLRNYRELRFLDTDLRRWQENIVAFRDMLALRRQAYRQRLPLVEQQDQPARLAQIRRQAEALNERLNAIGPATVDLASADEQRQFQRLRRTRSRLDRHADEAGLASQRQKWRLLNGVAIWRQAAQYFPRRWTLTKELGALRQALVESDRRRRQLSEAAADAPRGFSGFSGRIDRLDETLRRQRQRLQTARAAHLSYLRTLLQQIVERHRERLRAYEVQARFGLARLHDLDNARNGQQP